MSWPGARRGIFGRRLLSLNRNDIRVALLLWRVDGVAMSPSLHEQTLRRIRAEYREMPDMRLRAELNRAGFVGEQLT